jgi:putative SOS response-associated peptidase YedK
VLETAAVLTTEANAVVRPIHDRMPVILRPEDYAAWLDPGRQEVTALRSLLCPWPAAQTEVFAVGIWVSDPRHEGERCLERETTLLP